MEIIVVYDSSYLNSKTDILKERLRNICRSVDYPVNRILWKDVREAPHYADVNIYLDFPVYSLFPWTFYNMVLKDSSRWSLAYDSYEADDLVLYENIETNLFDEAVVKALRSAKEKKTSFGNKTCPPILTKEDCPLISIITPTYNRRKFLPIAFHNLILTDYPKNKMEWIVVEDHENQTEMASDLFIQFQLNEPDIKVKYIPLAGKHSIGYKRNIGIENATHPIILFMDDDDHYPVTSFRRRVAWLLRGINSSTTILCCTAIAMYDLSSGKSAVNCPPYDLPLSKRISEATLTFFKRAWYERKFEDSNICEGEKWIEGREHYVIEIPPQQIIVAFSHGNNQSKRRVPEIAKIGCFWGFPVEYLKFIHGIIGVSSL